MYMQYNTFWFIVELIFFLALFIPTIIAFLTGAPWVPTPMARARRMAELAELRPGDRVYELGCGDGRLAQLAAEKYGADAIGLELSPIVYAVARIRNALKRSQAKILLRDFRRINYSNARALMFYLLPDILRTIKPKLERELAPGARVVSYAFEIPGWTPVHVEPRDAKRHFGRIFVYQIPKSLNANGNDASA